MDPDSVVASWGGMRPPEASNELTAIELEQDSGVWAALDSSGNEHLLIEVPSDSRFNALSTHGLSAALVDHRVSGRQPAKYVDIACTDRAVLQTFGAVVADLATLAASEDADTRLTQVNAGLSRWKWFWSVDPSAMSSAEIVGLFGELWFLLRWAQSSLDAIEAWTGSTGARHDFQWPDRSVEVKTSSRATSTVHRIESLDQLDDPEQGLLFLFTLNLQRDVLARNTLNSLVNAITDSLADSPAVRDDFTRKLSSRGFTPADPRATDVSYRVLEQRLFRVDRDFPRLTRSSFPGGLPAGVGGVAYEVDVAACSPWLVGATPDVWPPDMSTRK